MEKFNVFNGSNVDEIRKLFSFENENEKGLSVNITVEERDVSIPEWATHRLTVPVLKIEYLTKDVFSSINNTTESGKKILDITDSYKMVYCVAGDYVVYNPDEKRVHTMKPSEFKKLYDVEKKEVVDNIASEHTNVESIIENFHNCANCVYKQLYQLPKPSYSPYDPQYPWNPNQTWCKVENPKK